MQRSRTFILPFLFGLILSTGLRAQVIDPMVPYFNILAPYNIAGIYQPGQFGAAMFGNGVTYGDVVGSVIYPSDSLYCTPGTDDFSDKIVLINRGSCTFSLKVANAESRGAIGVIILNFDESAPNMALSDSMPTIPSVIVPLSLGQAIAWQIQQGENVVVAFSAEPINTLALLEGHVRADDNTDCVAGAGETGLKDWLLVAEGTGKTYYGRTNASGKYKIFLDTVNTPYTLTALPPIAIWSACPATQTVDFTQVDTLVRDFSAQSEVDCPQLSVDIATPFLRRCFPNTFVVEVCNIGSVQADDAYVDISLDSPGFEPIFDNTAPYSIQPDGDYRFPLGDLAVGQCINFNFKSVVSCDSTVIGQTLCYHASGYPDTLCVGSVPGWSGATVSVTGECLGDSIRFEITNTGSATMSMPRDFIVIEDDVMLQSGQFLLAPGAQKIVMLPANGSTYRLEASQEPFHPISGLPASTVEGCTSNGGSFSVGYFLLFPLYDAGAPEDRECQELIGSYDPNDKIGYPLGVGPDHYIRPETELEYRIRFQNTGTDTAFTVVVRDTLSPWLDPLTLRPGAGSHPYELSLNNGNQLVFTFPQINLVDSFANEAASHGFLTFRINQKEGNTDGTVIENRAGIYFDFNAAIMTNTTRHEIGELPHVQVSTYLPPSLRNDLQVFPNPVAAPAVLTVVAALPDGTPWRLFDENGRLQTSGQLQGRQLQLHGGRVTPGIYWLEFQPTPAGPISVAKLIVR